MSASNLEREFNLEIPSVQTLIEKDPLLIPAYYSDADMEELAVDMPDLVEMAATAILEATLNQMGVPHA